MCNRLAIIAAIILVTSISFVPATIADTISRHVLSAGGTNVSNATYSLRGTLKQTIIGTQNSTSYEICSGFWGNKCNSRKILFAPQAILNCCFELRGNIDADPLNEIGLLDLGMLQEYLYGLTTPTMCVEEADVNADGIVDLRDFVFLISYLFNHGSDPLPCQLETNQRVSE